MITIEYCKEGFAVSDFNYADLYEEVLKIHRAGKTVNIKLSNEILIERIRLGIVDNEIHCDDLILLFNGKRLKFNQYGSLLYEGWPKGLFDHLSRISTARMKRGMEKRSILERR